jgi:WD40 repeat protein
VEYRHTTTICGLESSQGVYTGHRSVERHDIIVRPPREPRKLGVEADRIYYYRHGRDGHLRVWHLDETTPFSTKLPVEGEESHRPAPWLRHSLAVNTLNFCSFSMCQEGAKPSESIMVAFPAKRIGAVDVYGLPSEALLHKVPASTAVAKPNMVMALRLVLLASDNLCLLTALESGAVIAQVCVRETSAWTTVYHSTVHTQPTLGLDVALRSGCYFTSGADAVVARHVLPVDGNPVTAEPEVSKTGHAGQQNLSLRSDDSLFATAGWDSRVRVYSAKSMREVAVLTFHKGSCYAVAFGDMPTDSTEQEPAEQKSKLSTTGVTLSSGRREKASKATHWLAAGSKDGKVSLWDVF